MHAMILAAGFGTRLWPLTIDRTKPAIPVLNRPLVAYTVDYLRQAGIQELVVNLHHQGESVSEALGDGSQFGCRIQYSDEADQILGTSGALDHARHLLEHGPFVVMNGKVITNIDLRPAIDLHFSQKALATLVLRPNTSRERFSMIEVDDRGWVTRFAGFPAPHDGIEEPLMFTGIQILDPAIFEFIPRGVFSHSTTDVYPKAMAQGLPVVGYVSRDPHEYWYEFSTLRRYLDLSLHLHHQSTVIGEGCQIAPSAQITDSVIWNHVQIGPGSRIHRAIIGDNVVLPAESNLEQVVVVRADKLSSEEFEKHQPHIFHDNLVVEF